ncbi:26s proteasome regulatory subunit [Trichoderma arundinaceum]|uniref:26s proteasome regulatory subunit n=1 Tax=Trichoderma arundinaceum TaxID=490622 RepID=A0A395N7F1_TRIAR|nr:26s proteasome regulatory subunit [Trichoderma arundinaceum]
MLSVDHKPTSYQQFQQQQYSNTNTNNTNNHHHQLDDFTFGQDNDFDFSTSIFPSTELSAANLEHLNAAVISAFSPDSMRPDSWEAAARFSTPKFGRLPHQRESSLSSLGSTGPASPFNSHIANPQIAVTDANGDGFMDMHSHDISMTSASPYYQLAKTMPPYSSFHHLDNASVSDMAYPVAIPANHHHKMRQDRNLLPAPEFANGLTRSHPASVASSIAGDSPATPITGDMDMSDRRRQGRRQPQLASRPVEDQDSSFWLAGHGNGNVPKLDRTMTDVYGDELYNPNFTITSSPQQSQVTAAPSDVFNQRISAANSQHLSTIRHSPTSSISRDMSPFRQGSPLAPSPLHDWAASHHHGVALNSQPRMPGQDHGSGQQDAHFFQQHMTKTTQPGTPQTISPKDAVLEFNESGEESNMPLFSHNPISFGMDHMGRMLPEGSVNGPAASQYGQGDNASHIHNLPPHASSGIPQLPQRYPFIAYPSASQDASAASQLSSADSNSTGSAAYNTPVPQGRPAGANADGGTYTCTYHGCTLRFETPTLLQKHKREGHRQSHGLASARPHHDHSGMTSSLLNSQAGPHRCDRINPSTGKPCNTIFSRPYDLTRHEDTIHNAKKQKVHCNLCTEEKTFSRADALTRHYRVCHPDVELPGKHRRRGGA